MLNTMLTYRRPTVVRRVDPFEQIVDQFFGAAPAVRRPRRPEVISQTDDAGWRFTVDLPGVPAEHVKVSVSARVLTVAVRPEADAEPMWSHSLRLGSNLDADAVAAHYADGRLTVLVPFAKVETPPVREIELSATPAPAISAATHDDDVIDAESSESAPEASTA